MTLPPCLQTHAQPYGLIAQDLFLDDRVITLLQLADELAVGELLHDAAGDFIRQLGAIGAPSWRSPVAAGAHRAPPALVLADFDA